MIMTKMGLGINMRKFLSLSFLILLLSSNILNAESKGYQLKDICILVRSKKDGLIIVNTLLDIDNSFISEDCLFLNSSIPYKILYSFLKYLESNKERDLKILQHFLSVHLSKEPQLFETINHNLKNIFSIYQH